MELKTNHKLQCWYWFAEHRQEELYEIIQAMITDKINEVLPPMVEEIMRQKMDNFSLDIQTTVNGKSSANLKEAITDILIKELQK